MKERAYFGLQAQFGLAITVALIVGAALLGVLLQRQEAIQVKIDSLGRDAVRAIAVEELNRRGEDVASEVADALAAPMSRMDIDAIDEVTNAAASKADVLYVLVFNKHGQEISYVSKNTAEPADKRVSMQDSLAANVLNSNGLLTQQTDRVLEVSQVIKSNDARLGGVRIGYFLRSVQIKEDIALSALHEKVNDAGSHYIRWIVLLLITLLLVCGGIIWYAQRTLIKPIRTLIRSANALGRGHYDVPRKVVDRQDEIGELVRAFAEMSANISRHEYNVRQMAYTDALTGLANRLAFDESLERHVQSHGDGRELALLFADIDDFKRINDTLGHSIGDEVLLHFAKLIRDAVERLAGKTAMVARFGGDEFVILLKDHDVRSKASVLAEEVIRLLGEPLEVTAQVREILLGTSIGITLFPNDADDAKALLKNCDVAMYQAKMAGKNCYRFYSRAMDYAITRRLRMEVELRGAWERNEFSVLYQPIYRLSDNQIVGAEALLRWHHPEFGEIPPSVFIELAEQDGLIEQIGPRVLRVACAAAARWKPASDMKTPFISVNVSPSQLRNGRLYGLVNEALNETGLEPGRLHLELTETAIIKDQVRANKLLTKLHREGVKIWLDDFGTGFSGLNHLRRVPVDGIKIDRSFITDFQRDPDDLALTTAIIAMAHSLGISVIAEGVEKQAQLNILRERGCDLVQGFWLGYPLSESEFNVLLGT